MGINWLQFTTMHYVLGVNMSLDLKENQLLSESKYVKLHINCKYN